MTRRVKRISYTKRDIADINRIVGHNLRKARDSEGIRVSDAMWAIYGVTNNRNRISEIENGHKNLTLIDMLMFQELYGKSLDYLCGLSVEPEVDMLAGTVNHVVNQSQSMIERLTLQVAEVLVGHVKSVSKDNSVALVDCAKNLCGVIKDELDGRLPSPHLSKALRETLDTLRAIEAEQERERRAVETQMVQRCERMDKEDGHLLLSDRKKSYQFSLPLPKPHIIDEVMPSEA